MATNHGSSTSQAIHRRRLRFACFGRWYKAEHPDLDLPEHADKVNSWFGKFRTAWKNGWRLGQQQQVANGIANAEAYRDAATEPEPEGAGGDLIPLAQRLPELRKASGL